MTTRDVTNAATLGRFADYLHLLARAELDPRLRRDCDPADIVQIVLFKAHLARDSFRGTTTEELAGWFRQILANTLADALRARLRDRRDVRLEVSLEQSLAHSSERLAACVPCREPTPSALVEKAERGMRLAAALGQLPPPQREAVMLKHFEGRSLAEVAEKMDRTAASVASLLRRGLARLREILAEEDSHGA
jgi:RNA polymerase sigma-70 factor (ECF subfamily)